MTWVQYRGSVGQTFCIQQVFIVKKRSAMTTGSFEGTSTSSSFTIFCHGCQQKRS